MQWYPPPPPQVQQASYQTSPPPPPPDEGSGSEGEGKVSGVLCILWLCGFFFKSVTFVVPINLAPLLSLSNVLLLC